MFFRSSAERVGRAALLLAAALLAAVASAQNAPCGADPGVNLAYAGSRVDSGDLSFIPFAIPPVELLGGPDWQLFLNQANPSQSFSYPLGWRPSILQADAVNGDAGVRLDAPDGRAALEVFFDGASMFTPRGPVSLEDYANFAVTRLVGQTPYQVLCVDRFISPQLASTGITNLFAAVQTQTHAVAVRVLRFSDSFGMEPSFSYVAYAGPIAEFERLIRGVFGPVLASFPKGGGGGDCTCDLGEPDRDNDGVCDRCDDFPDDPDRS